MSVKSILTADSFDDQTKNVFCNAITVKKFKTDSFLLSPSENEPAAPDTPNKILYVDADERLSVKNSFDDKHGIPTTYFSNGTVTTHLDDNAIFNSLLDRDATHAQGDVLSRPNVFRDGTVYKLKVYGFSNVNTVASADFICKVGNLILFTQPVTFQVIQGAYFEFETFIVATEQNDDLFKMNYVYNIKNSVSRLSSAGQSPDTFTRLAGNRLDLMCKWNGQGLGNEIVTVLSTVEQIM